MLARFARILLAHVCLPQIVNRNLIGRFTVFVETAPRFPSAQARAVSTRNTHVVYAVARTSPVVCQPLNTGHPRSSPIFSPIHPATDSAALLINETPHIYPVLGRRALSLPAGGSHCCVCALLHIVRRAPRPMAFPEVLDAGTTLFPRRGIKLHFRCKSFVY